MEYESVCEIPSCGRDADNTVLLSLRTKAFDREGGPADRVELCTECYEKARRALHAVGIPLDGPMGDPRASVLLD